MTAFAAWALATGQVSYVITSGTSMNPVYHQGDLVVVAEAGSYRVGEIAAYRENPHAPTVLHRIIAKDPDGFVLKGDNNASVDPFTPAEGDLLGRAVLHVPAVGRLLGPVLSPTGLAMIGFMLVSTAGPGIRSRRDLRRDRREKKKKKVGTMAGHAGPARSTASALRAIAELPPALRAVSAVLAAVAGAGIALAVLGWGGPVAQAVPAEPGDGQSMTFSYSATVPRTPAYDGTTVGPPDPVFRRLARVVDLSMTYRGRPGRIEVAAKLSTASGWHTRMVLAAPRAFAQDRLDAKVRLDLDALDDRATEAADAIGVAPGPVSIAVEAVVTADGGATFRPTLLLTMTPLHLALAGGPESLVVEQTAAATAGSVVPREISLLGRPVLTAQAARGWSVCVLLGVAFGAVGVGMVARREQPVRDPADIHRRYKHLLVAVEPLTSPPGKPVVNVDDFHTLVRLAERYGLLIFHWSRNDSETFVVRDEGVTYRFRTDVEPALPDAPAPVSVEKTHQPT
jgi:signal peptidase I